MTPLKQQDFEGTRYAEFCHRCYRRPLKFYFSRIILIRVALYPFFILLFSVLATYRALRHRASGAFFCYVIVNSELTASSWAEWRKNSN
jgi:hypothetical protein